MLFYEKLFFLNILKSSKNNQAFPDLNPSHNQHHQHNNQHHHYEQHQSKNSKKNEESLRDAFLRTMTISDEFMKWCEEQLLDFHVDCNLILISKYQNQLLF